MLSDLEIAQSAPLKPITEIAKSIGKPARSVPQPRLTYTPLSMAAIFELSCAVGSKRCVARCWAKYWPTI